MLEVFISSNLNLFCFLDLTVNEKNVIIRDLNLQLITKEEVFNIKNNIKAIIRKFRNNYIYTKCGYEISYNFIPPIITSNFNVEEEEVSFWNTVENEKLTYESFSSYVENFMEINGFTFKKEDDFYGINFDIAYNFCGNKKKFNDCVSRGILGSKIINYKGKKILLDGTYFDESSEGIIVTFIDERFGKVSSCKLWYDIYDVFRIVPENYYDDINIEGNPPREINENITHPYFYIYLQLIFLYILNEESQKVFEYGNQKIISYCSDVNSNFNEKIEVLRAPNIENTVIIKIIIEAVKETYL